MADIETASDKNFTPSTIEVVTSQSIAATDGFSSPFDAGRLQQQGLTPSSVTPRGLTQLVAVSPEVGQVYLGTLASLDDSTTAIFLTNLADPAGRLIVAVPEVAWKINGYPYATNGAGVGFRLGPINAFFDYSRSDGNNLAYITTLTNLSGNTINNVQVFIRFRVISNPTAPTGSTT